MLPQWLPFLKPRLQPRDARFKHSLVQTVLVVLLLASLLPIVLLGALNGSRQRTMLLKQVDQTLTSISASQVDEINTFISQNNQKIDHLVTNGSFHDALFALLNRPQTSEEYLQAKTDIQNSFVLNPEITAEKIFDQAVFIRPDGTIALATNDTWAADNLGSGIVKDELIKSLIGTNKALFAYSPFPAYTGKMVLLTSRSFVDEKSIPMVTLVTVADPDMAYRTLGSLISLLPYSSSSYFTKEGMVYGRGENNSLVETKINRLLANSLKGVVTSQASHERFVSTDPVGDRLIVSTEWIPEYNLGVMVTVPELKAVGPTTLIDPVSLALLLISLGISSAVIYFGSTQFINPLIELSNVVENFSKGNWEARVSINRSDEIGLLSASFNGMADELSDMYRSIEGVLEKHTRQLRIASEVAQQATAATKFSDTLGKTVTLIAERFEFYHVAIYLLDETGKYLILREAAGVSGEEIKQRGERIDSEENTLIAWTASHQQARIIANTQEDPLYLPNDLLPDTQSEVAIPISLGGEMLGVLDIRSTLPNAFDDETIIIFQTLTNQISTTLQSSRLLETTQISYQETSLLYRTTRQVTQARSEKEIIQNLTDAFIQLPFISAILTAAGGNFNFLVITDSKTGRVETGLQGLTIPIGQMVEHLTENRIELIEDITQPSNYENLTSFLLRRGCRSAALISILENGRVSKVLALGSRETGQFTRSSLQPYANLAEVIGAALEKYRVLNTLQLRLSELQILASFSQAISAETNLGNLYRILHEQVMQTLDPELEFAIALYHEDKDTIEFPYFYENKQLVNQVPLKRGEGLTSIVIDSHQPLLLTSEREIRAKHAVITGDAPRSWMGIPLIFAGRIVGAMIVQDLVNENQFNQDDVNLFMTLAPQIATAVRNAQLYTETQQALKAYDQERFLLNTLLDNMPEGITFKDSAGRYIRASSSIARIFNTQPEEIIGKSDYDLMEHDNAEKIFREEQMVMNLGQAEIGLTQYAVTPSGKETWTHTSRIPIRTLSGDPYGLLLIQRDITELKQAEALAQRRAEQVLTAAEIARDATGTLDVKLLLQKSINLVRERFGYYHASTFLLDPAGEYAVLRESTGQAGQQMMQAGHRLAVGSKSIVGQVTATGKALIVNDVTHDPTHLPNPLLPETRSELAIPLMVGDRILGALDVQSTQFNAFITEDVSVLQILADQLAVAVVNSELFSKTQELLGKHRLLRQISIGASTSTNLEDAIVNVVSGLRTAMVGDRIAILMLNNEGILQVQASAGYEGTRHLEARTTLGEGITGLAALEKRPIRVDDASIDPRYISLDPDVRSELAIPILFSDELLGVLNLESTRMFAFDENDQEILGALGNNLGGVIANIRLVNQVRQQVTYERKLFETTSKIRRSVDLETILATSAKEIAQALGARRASIRITAGSMPPAPEQREERIPKREDGNGDRGKKNGQEA